MVFGSVVLYGNVLTCRLAEREYTMEILEQVIARLTSTDDARQYRWIDCKAIMDKARGFSPDINVALHKCITKFDCGDWDYITCVLILAEYAKRCDN